MMIRRRYDISIVANVGVVAFAWVNCATTIGDDARATALAESKDEKNQ